MAAHNHIRLKNACFHHDGFGFRRHHLFARTAVHGDRSGSVRAREELRDGYGGSHPHGTLRAVLVVAKYKRGTPRRASYSRMTPRFGPGVPRLYLATKAVESPATGMVSSKSCASR